jgi:hypothetical protein
VNIARLVELRHRPGASENPLRPLPPTEPIYKWHLGHLHPQVGDFTPMGGEAVDPQGTIVRFDGKHEAAEKAVQSLFPFLKLGFCRLTRSWVWYRVDRESVVGFWGCKDFWEGRYVQDVVTVIQPCFDALWETRDCDRQNSVVHAYREPSVKEDVSLLTWISENRPDQLLPTAGGPWVAETLRTEYRALLRRRQERAHKMAMDAVEEWSHFVDRSTLDWKTRVVVPDKPKLIVPGGGK